MNGRRRQRGFLINPYVFAAAGGGGADPMDDEFAGGALDAKWTWRQQNAAVVNVAGGLGDFIGDPATGDPTVHNIYQPVPAAVCRFRARVAGHVNANFAICGLHLRNSTVGALTVYGYHNNSFGRRLVAIRFTAETAYSSNVVEIADPDPDNFQVLELELTATHVIFRTSLDGVSFTDQLNEAKGTFMEAGGGTIDQVGFAVCVFGAAANQRQEIDWFRREA